MLISKKMEEALIKHMNAEFESWYIYLAMSAWAEERNFLGFAKWLKIQADEEMTHAMKFFNYLHEVGANAELLQIPAIKKDWKNFIEVFEKVLNHEIKITNAINDLYNMAHDEKDHATKNFLNWFVEEQVEEVAQSTLALEKVKMAGDNIQALLFLDSQFGQREKD